jgi:uncharacterized membrane protein
MLINKESIIVPALSSVILFLVRKITGWDLFYFLNLLSIVWLSAAVASRLFKHIITNISIDNRRADIIAAVIVLTYGIVLSAMSIARHEAYSTSMYDLGNMDQAIWNSSQGNFLEVTSIGPPCLNVSRAINHLEWIYEIFALLYKVIPGIRVLLVVQTLFVCIGLTGLYFILKATMQSPGLRILSLCIAALFPALQFANLFDFHGDLLAFPFLMWMIYFYDVRQKPVIAVLLMTGSLLCKEYVALVLAFYGIVMIVQYKDWRWGSVVTCISTGYFISAYYLIMPAFNHGISSEIISAIYTTKPGTGLYGLFAAVYENPGRYLSVVFSEHSFESLFYLFFPVFFFLWKDPVFLIPVIPVLIKDLLAGIDIGTHRLALTIPFIFASFVYTIRKMEVESQERGNGRNSFHVNLLLILSATVIASVTYGPSPLGHRFYREIRKYVKDTNDLARDSVIAHIPDNAVVSVSGVLAPHCTHRRYCYQFPRPFNAQCSGTIPVDVIALDTNDEESRIENHTSFKMETIPWIVSMGFYQTMERSGVYLFRRSGSTDSKSQFFDERNKAGVSKIILNQF